jgi:hypothetical protein
VSRATHDEYDEYLITEDEFNEQPLEPFGGVNILVEILGMVDSRPLTIARLCNGDVVVCRKYLRLTTNSSRAVVHVDDILAFFMGDWEAMVAAIQAIQPTRTAIGVLSNPEDR